VVDFDKYQQMVWAANMATSVGLVWLLVTRKNYKSYPVFTFYISLNFILGLLLIPVYLRARFLSTDYFRYAWQMLATASLARALAVAEVCRRVLFRFTGIWELAKRLLLLCAAIVLAYSVLAGRSDWKRIRVSADRSLELCIATVIVVLLLLTRYYNIPTVAADRWLAIGFCLYCCIQAINDTIADRYFIQYQTIWSFSGVVAFFASLTLWSWGLRKPRAVMAMEESLLSQQTYQEINPQINMRLRLLNENLAKFWRGKDNRR
jgi:hypothetical protein